jgi:transcriptional regulator GlxA family with amidase domain
VAALDVVGPLDVFAGATRIARVRGLGAGYTCLLASRDGRPVRAGGGLLFTPDARLDRVRGPIDTLLVAGAFDVRTARADRQLIAAIAATARRARRIASVCTGAALLAEAGLLDGRRATTHWAYLDVLAHHAPRVRVERGPIHVADGNVHTSAGVTTGMDLALDLVEEDLGRDAALELARWLVMFVKRPGNQTQFSAQLSAQLADRDALRTLQAAIAERPDANHSVPALARRAGMSRRNFARLFRRQVGVSPGRYVEAARLEVARRRLEESQDSAKVVAASSGFASADSMRRAFLRRLGTVPTEYRKRFGARRGAAGPT